MLIETKFGNFELIKNEREAFDIVKFEAKYLPEYFDKYTYMVGDLADDILRLKGFSTDPKSSAYFHFIPEYLQESCAYNCKYYILKRMNGKEVEYFEPEVKKEAKQFVQKEEVKPDIKKSENKPNVENQEVKAQDNKQPEEQKKFNKNKKKKFYKKFYKKKQGGNNESRTNN